MKKDNVFYIKKIVDKKIDDDSKRVYTQSIVDETKKEIKKLSDDDFCEVMIGCFIPDTYKDQGKKEKLYTKLAELMVGEWWHRMGGKYKLPTKKSGTEDVEMIYDNKSIVCDVKIFRLGRSQKAPNVKDFLKLASVQTWIANLNKRYKNEGKTQIVLGGLVTYSSLHEWEQDSEVYLECSNKKTSVVMLPYEIMTLLLKYKGSYTLTDFLDMWDYKKIKMRNSTKKKLYWDTIESFLRGLLNIDNNKYNEEINKLHQEILEAKDEYTKLITDEMAAIKKNISDEVNKYSNIDELKVYAIEKVDSYKNAKNRDYIDRIGKFRKFD